MYLLELHPNILLSPYTYYTIEMCEMCLNVQCAHYSQVKIELQLSLSPSSFSYCATRTCKSTTIENSYSSCYMNTCKAVSLVTALFLSFVMS